MCREPRTGVPSLPYALGFTPKQIGSIFLAEAALTGVIGGVFGLLLGFVLAFFMGGIFAGFGVGGGRGFGQSGGGSAAGITIQPVFSSGLILFSLGFPVLPATLAGSILRGERRG